MTRAAAIVAAAVGMVLPGLAIAQAVPATAPAGGSDMLYVIIIAVGAAAVALVIAAGLTVYLVGKHKEEIDALKDRQVRMSNDIARLTQRLVSVEEARAAPPPRAAIPEVPPRVPTPEVPPPPRVTKSSVTPEASRALDRKVEARDRLQRYRELLASRAKPRQLQDVIDEDATHSALLYDPAGRGLSLVPFDANDPGQLLVAIAGPVEGTYLVLPTYNYLEAFRVAFSSPVQNPELVRHLFDFDKDDSGNLQLIDAALIKVDETGSAQKSRAGRMSGYSAGG